MKPFCFLLILIMPLLSAQSLSEKLNTATQKLLKTTAGKGANLSFFVADETTGKKIFGYEENKGLTTASTQKIFTAGAAFELLGKDFRYTTTVSHSGNIVGKTLDGDLILHSEGDPTFGSWRYNGYKPEDFKQKIIEVLKSHNILTINGNIFVNDDYFDFQTIPEGWEWGDVGNYYGAGVWSVNWRENQFDLILNNGSIEKTNPPLPEITWVNETTTGGKSDNSLIFTAPHSKVAFINGRIPSGKITVSGAMPNPPLTLGHEIKTWLNEEKIDFRGEIITHSQLKTEGKNAPNYQQKTLLLAYQSPKMEEIIHWFLRKSVNLYGETILKTLAKKQSRNGFSDGVSILKDFWKSKGISSTMINFADGSGLSPKNYVSAKAEVQALLYAKKQSWFASYLDSFPTLNGMKMKSGTMRFTKSFVGYHTAKDGKKYVYAIIINNYQGSDASEALFQILNILK